MKNISKLLLSFILGLCLLACSSNDVKKETISSYKEEISQEIENAIYHIVENKVEAVNKRDIEKYLSTVNEKDKEYFKEQEHWFQDIMLNDISDYSLEVIDIEIRSEDSYLVSLKQQYHYKNKNYTLNFKSLYRKKGKEFVDCDLDFSSLETEHFLIKYTQASKGLLDKIARDAEEGYEIVKKNYGKVPRDKTVIKIYDDMETLRQFVKLSFQWNMAGWYEYPESIKYIGLRSTINAKGFAHELTHKVTIEDSNNNMPYWFAEGLAAHYSEDYYSKLVTENKMTIKELRDTNLEQLTEDSEVLKYYGSSQSVVEFMIEEYGEVSIEKIIQGLSKYPFQEGNGREEDLKRNEVFNIVIQEVLGKNLEELDSEFKESTYIK